MFLSSFQNSVAVLVVASQSIALAGTFDLPILFDNSYVSNSQTSTDKIACSDTIGFQASVEVQIGTPSSTYRLHFDTGSATTWVANEQCASSTCSNGSG